MKTSVHPALVAAAIASALAVAVLGFAKFGGGPSPTQTASIASPYGFGPGQRMEMPTSAGTGRNSITGEPLSPTAIAAEQESFARLSGARPENAPPPGTDLLRNPTPPRR